MVERWAVAARGHTLHLTREQRHLEAQLGQQPGEEAVILAAETTSALVHYLGVQKGKGELDSPAAVHRQVFKRNRHQVTYVNQPQHLQAGLCGAREPDARQICLHVHRIHYFLENGQLVL